MRLVQDEIRYVSLSMGSGSYIPRDPATVVQSGFGDCKDKALLLTSALARLGVSAQVALADLDHGRALDQHLPALRNFDHAIVKATIGTKAYWLDATNYLQGGDASNFPQPDYGFALPVFGSGELEKMPSPEPKSPTIKVAEEFFFPDKPGGQLTLSVLSTHEGADADYMRSKLASRSVSELSDAYLQYYSKRYPGIESAAKLEIFDNRDGDIINIRESYRLPAQALAANDLAKNFSIKAADLGTDLPTPTTVDRAGPVSLGSPVYRRPA
ncbi:transglutaminase family protein, partial [Mesorhizobium sp. M1A.F.Ca.IN.022.04.1.1]